jgi:hypothetical protein
VYLKSCCTVCYGISLQRDYVSGNAEIITKNYNSLPEYERPVYVFNGEDEHQKVAHIQYDNKWVVEREW